MNNDVYMSSNPQLEAAIAECTDASRIPEIIKSHLESAGLLANDRGEYGIKLNRPISSERLEQQSKPSIDLAPKATDTEFRVLYPNGNNRVEIYGASQAELDFKEAQVRATFGARQ